MVAVDWYRDADGDLFGDAADSAPISSCAPQPGRVSNGRDCDDSDSTIHPAATEACDGLDNDCSGVVDEGATLVFRRDRDLDGFGSMLAGDEVAACAAPDGYIARGGDCDDDDPYVYPGAPEVCDRRYDDCRSPMAGMPRPEEDRDDDGWAPLVPTCFGGPRLRGDCSDLVASANPGVTTYAETPYCPSGGPVCRLGGTWYCGAPRAGSVDCASVGGMSPPASFDYDCDGSETAEPAFSALGCRCSLDVMCLEAGSAGSMLRRTQGPAYMPGASCGDDAGWSQCSGSCPGACSTRALSGHRVPCR